MKTFVAAVVGAIMGAAGLWTAQNLAAAAQTEPVAAKPAYLVVLGDVHDREAFARQYVAKLPPLYSQYGGEYLAVGRNYDLLEGEGGFQSFVISKWPSMEAGRAFWNSPEYAALREARVAGNWGRFDVFLLEGLPAQATSAAK